MKHLIFAATMSVMATPVLAADLASAHEIMAKLTGQTVQGSMADGSAYTEFYEGGGMIKGVDYTGHWGVVGNQMCFAYGDDPAGCWFVRIDGDTVTWVANGKDDGTGTVVAGNPNNF